MAEKDPLNPFLPQFEGLSAKIELGASTQFELGAHWFSKNIPSRMFLLIYFSLRLPHDNGKQDPQKTQNRLRSERYFLRTNSNYPRNFLLKDLQGRSEN
jgi:hypothetical protein